MPNSSLVIQAKNDMLVALQNDDRIIEALGIHDDEDIDNLIADSDKDTLSKKRLFPHWFVPKTQDIAKTYICIEAGVTAIERRFTSSVAPKTYDMATITIYVLSHQDDLYMNKAGVSAIRPDYLSVLIDEKFNGSNEFGIGTLQRISNEPYSLKDNAHRYRQIVFQAVDFNDNMCEVIP